MRQARISSLHRTDQRIDHLTLNTISEMAGISDILKAAPAIRNFLIFRQRIGDERKDTKIFTKGFCQRLRGFMARFAISVLQLV